MTDAALQELRRQATKLSEENAELREQVAQRDRWIAQLKHALAALTRPDAA